MHQEAPQRPLASGGACTEQPCLGRGADRTEGGFASRTSALLRCPPVYSLLVSCFPARKMLALLAALLLLRSAPAGWAHCLGSPNSGSCEVLGRLEFSNTLTCLNLSNCGIREINGSARLGGSVKMLDLSFNRLQTLPPDFLSQAHTLKELYLQHNQLRGLPTEFFKNASSLLHLVLDCECDVVASVLSHCMGSSPTNSTEPACHCHSAQEGPVNVTAFYRQECQPRCALLCVALTSSVLAGLLLAGGLAVALLLLRRKRQASAIHSKRESTASVARGQPRYISRNAEPGPGQASNYENIFIGQPGGQYECLERKGPQYRAQQLVDEECYMETDTGHGDQPIYANTQQLYSSSVPAPSDGEDVYIMPDK
ncbi:leucine-rich repeat-containing protein 25 isoform X1 [Natator depressus]|uniref:leucine-rich repeat-containing protein 25 isoform X1 n=2 Tax=Natator depressus TaxID=27790 RepID=UPI003EBF35BA